MSTSAWGRVLAAAIVLAIAAPFGSAEEALPRPTVELELSSAMEITPALSHMPPGADALDRLLAPTLIPLPGIESFDWFAESSVAAPGQPCCTQCAAPPQSPPSFGGSLCCRPKLFGDVCGLRPRLAERGVNFDIYSTNFYSQVFNGGLQETAQYRGRLDMLLNIDGEKAGLWKGLFIDLHGESIWGNTINQYTGTIMPVSIAQLVPVPNGSVTALTGVKFTQALSERLIVFGGKLNLLDGFNQPFTGGARGVDGFWNGGLLFNPVLIRTVPYSSYGFGTAVLRNLEPIFTFLVLDANNTPTTTGFNSFFADGVDLVAQLNIPTRFFGMPGHQGLIGSWSSKKYSSLDRSAFLNVLEGAPTSTLRKDGAWSLGYTFDQALVVSATDPKRMWGVFGNLGIADDNPSPIRWFANIGIGGSSPIEGRKLDTFGLGYYYAGLSGSIKSLAPALLPLRDEHGLEAFYNVGVTPWCHITPDVQFILPANDNAQHMWFFGLRARLDF